MRAIVYAVLENLEWRVVGEKTVTHLVNIIDKLGEARFFLDQTLEIDRARRRQCQVSAASWNVDRATPPTGSSPRSLPAHLPSFLRCGFVHEDVDVREVDILVLSDGLQNAIPECRPIIRM